MSVINGYFFIFTSNMVSVSAYFPIDFRALSRPSATFVFHRRLLIQPLKRVATMSVQTTDWRWYCDSLCWDLPMMKGSKRYSDLYHKQEEVDLVFILLGDSLW